MTQSVQKTDLVTLTIDDVEVSVPKDSLVIRAAEQVGVQIPRFCDHPLLAPVGACRQCLVEVWAPRNGELASMGKPQASCTLAVTDGMVVKTQVSSKVADKAQQGVMEFLLVNHPLDCPVCDKGGECPLQNQAMSNGRGESRFSENGGTKRTFPKPINISAQVLLDRERCVLCARCTRFSEQIAGDPFIALIERGALQQVGIYEKEPFESYFSGNTIQICPVGALTSASYRFRSRPFDLVSTPSVCEHCAAGCSLRTDHRRGKVTRRLAGNDPDVNEEWNCDKGRFAFLYARQEDRLTTPLVRDEETGRHRPGLVARGVRRRRPRPAGTRRPGRRADRRPAHRRGRLRLQQVRPRGARHQRHRLPGPPALRRGGRLPGLARGRQGPRGHLRRPRAGQRRAARRARARGRVADRVPAAAQGRPQGPHPGRLDRPVHLPRPAEDARHAGPHRPGRRARRPGGARPRRRDRPRRRRRDPGRRAARHRPGRADRGADPGRHHRCPARVGPAPGGGARCARDRLPAEPAARWPSGHRRRRPRRPRHRVGHHRAARDRPRRRRDHRGRGLRRAHRAGGRRGGPRRPARPRAPPPRRSRRPASWSASRSAPAPSRTPPTWSSPSPRSPRRPACSWTGRVACGPSRRCCATRTRCPTCGCSPASPTRWACASASAPSRRPAPRCRTSVPGTAPGPPCPTSQALDARRARTSTADRRCGWRRGSCCSTTGGCSTATTTSRPRRVRRSRWCRPRRSTRSASSPARTSR